MFQIVELLALVGIIFAVIEFNEANKARRIESNGLAWQILSTQAPGNLDKIWALNHLALGGHNLDGIDLSCEAMGGKARYKFVGEGAEKEKVLTGCGSPTYLRGFFKQVREEKGDDYEISLNGANFSGADLRGADLQGAKVSGADFSEHTREPLPKQVWAWDDEKPIELPKK